MMSMLYDPLVKHNLTHMSLMFICIVRHAGRPVLTGLSPLFLAAENGHAGVCRQLVRRHGRDVEDTADNG